MGILVAFLSATIQAVSYIFNKRGYKTLQPEEGYILQAIWGVIVWIPVTLYLGVDWDSLWWVLIFGVVSAIMSEAFVYYVLSKGEISITGTIFSTYSVYTVLFSIIFNNERPSLIQFVFIGFAILGTLILSLPKDGRQSFISIPHVVGKFRESFVSFIKRKLKISEKYMLVLWPILGAISVGFADTLSKNVMDRTSFATFLFAVGVAQIPVSYIYLRMNGYQLSNTVKKMKSHFGEYKYFIIGTFLNVLSVMLLWLSFSLAFASIVSPVQASYPFVLVILARIFLNEKLNTNAMLGIIVTVMGVIGLAML